MIITLTGASGVGKTSVARKLIELMPELRLVISLTTRDPRPSDLPGEYRTNVPLAEFESRKEEFLWITPVIFGNRYGTLRSDVDSALASANPHLMILVPECIDLLRRYTAGLTTKTNKDRVISFYFPAPQESELRRRLRVREEGGAAIEKRIAECKKWDDAAINSSIPYFFILNDEPEVGIEKAAKEMLALIDRLAFA